MTLLITILSVIIGLLLLIVFFLVSEFLKKFGFMREFIHATDRVVFWHYPGHQASKTGMRNIVIRSDTPFSALIGFDFGIGFFNFVGFDHYGFVKSDGDNKAVFSTYLGKNPVELKFLITVNPEEHNVTVASEDSDQVLEPQRQFNPHWFQRIGFYG